MSLIYADRVKETSTTIGTGTLSLAGAATGFQTFVAGIGNGNTCYYGCDDGTDWEIGLGTVASGSPDTLARTTVLASSNSGSAVNWGAGTKTVRCVVPAAIFGSAYVNVDGTIPLTGNWDIGDAIYLATDKIRARDAAGLQLLDDGGNGIFIYDGGNVSVIADSAALNVTLQNIGTGGDPDVNLTLSPGTGGEGIVGFVGDGFVTATSNFYFMIGSTIKFQLSSGETVFRDDLNPYIDDTYDLGRVAKKWRELFCVDVTLMPSASRTPSSNGELVIEATSNTTLTFKLKGSDGTVRSGTITLA